MRKLFRYLLIGFYVFAGAYHFLNPEFYYGLIPDYLPFHQLINYASGVLEIVLAIGVGISKTRRMAVYGIILMLIAFIPAHVYFIQIGSCVVDSICVNPWVAWLRLLIIHPALIIWAWKIN